MNATHASPAIAANLQFAYSQFFVYDAALVSPACEWTERHSKQGFARRDRTVAVGTLLEFGTAEVTVELGAPPDVQSYERVLAVPLEILGGALAVDGPEESGGDRKVPLSNGNYRVTVAQKVLDEEREEIKIWMEKLDLPMQRSELLIVDEDLDPSLPLMETANAP